MTFSTEQVRAMTNAQSNGDYLGYYIAEEILERPIPILLDSVDVAHICARLCDKGDKSTILRQIAIMEEQGLLKRDRYGSCSLTEEGKALYDGLSETVRMRDYRESLTKPSQRVSDLRDKKVGRLGGEKPDYLNVRTDR